VQSSPQRAGRAASKRANRSAGRPDVLRTKIRWLLDHPPNGVLIDDVCLRTVDSWLVWQLTGGAEHLCEAGNASRTLLYDIRALDWNPDLLDIFGVPAAALPAAVASDQGFGATSGSRWCQTGHRLLP
jgi:glycerol kinase